MQFLGISLPEAAIIFVVALVIVGPSGMTSVARTLLTWRRRLEHLRSEMAGDMREYTQELAEQTGWNEVARTGQSLREEAQRTLHSLNDDDGSSSSPSSR